MLRILTLATLLLTGADHWTTYLCLHEPVSGWMVTEANPFAEWLFEWAGLGAGLLIDTAITISAVCFLTTTRTFDHRVKLGLLAIISIATGYAVVNNLGAITRMGLAPWSGIAA